MIQEIMTNYPNYPRCHDQDESIFVTSYFLCLVKFFFFYESFVAT